MRPSQACCVAHATLANALSTMPACSGDAESAGCTAAATSPHRCCCTAICCSRGPREASHDCGTEETGAGQQAWAPCNEHPHAGSTHYYTRRSKAAEGVQRECKGSAKGA